MTTPTSLDIFQASLLKSPKFAKAVYGESPYKPPPLGIRAKSLDGNVRSQGSMDLYTSHAWMLVHAVSGGQV